MGHQLGEQWHDHLKALAVGHLVAQTELHGLGQRVDHVLAVVVQDQNVSARVQNRRDVLGKIGQAQRCFHRIGGFPTQGLGRVFHGLFLCPAPCVVGGQVVSDTLFAVLFAQNGAEGLAGHVRVEEVTETIAALVFARGVVGVRQAVHEDHAHFLRQGLHGNRLGRRGAAGAHDGAVFFHHAPGHAACHIGFGLGVALHECQFLTQNAVALQGQWLHGLEHAAVAFAVDVLHSQLISAQFVFALVGVSAGQRQGQADSHRLAVARIVAEGRGRRVLHIERWGAGAGHHASDGFKGGTASRLGHAFSCLKG